MTKVSAKGFKYVKTYRASRHALHCVRPLLVDRLTKVTNVAAGGRVRGVAMVLGYVVGVGRFVREVEAAVESEASVPVLLRWHREFYDGVCSMVIPV